MKLLKKALLTTAAIGGLWANTAAAQSELKIKVSHVFPATHWLWAQAGEIFAKEVTEKTGGRITFEVYPAGQLGKETANTISMGIAESGVVVTSYEASKVPLTSVVELPGLHSTACEATARFWDLAREGGALFDQEYAYLGIRPLYVNVLTPYQIMTSGKKIESLDDVSGLKIRANGSAMDKTARAIGAVGVKVTSSETFDALSRGTIDGALWPIGSTYEVGLEGVLNYTVKGTKLGGGSTFYAISEDIWQDLSPDDQQIMLDAGMTAQKHLCSYLDALDLEVEEKMLAAGELEVTELTSEESERWAEAVKSVADLWVEELAGTGRPGSEILQAYKAASPAF